MSNVVKLVQPTYESIQAHYYSGKKLDHVDTILDLNIYRDTAGYWVEQPAGRSKMRAFIGDERAYHKYRDSMQVLGYRVWLMG